MRGTRTYTYKTIKDVIELYVRPTLGKLAKFYDLEAIAFDITYYRTIREPNYVGLDLSCRVLKGVHNPYSEFFDADMFWDVAEDSRKGN